MAYYGDDLTGSTDALEVLSKAGARTMLFLEPPTADTLSRYPGLQAIGVAGRTRSLTPEEMEPELTGAFDSLGKLGPEYVHYKVCSTFDSSPTRGSIGRAIEVGRRVFGSECVPLIVAAPILGRYCVFGNLYASAGIGASRKVYRLDRHPSASEHPSTPMKESDLRLHLAKQTDAKIESFELPDYELTERAQQQELHRLVDEGAEVILFDGLDSSHLACAASLVDAHIKSDTQVCFLAGSSGVESALGWHWQQKGRLDERKSWSPIEQVAQALVISGSCSPVTASQIQWATRSGFAEVALDTSTLVGSQSDSDYMQASTDQVLRYLESGKSVVVHTSLGINDPRVAATRQLVCNFQGDRSPPIESCAQLLGESLGRMIRQVLEESDLQRLCIAGGDTASWVSREMEIEAIEMVSPLTRGAPLCRVHAPNAKADGLEVVFKGGQVGDEDFFGALLTGSAA